MNSKIGITLSTTAIAAVTLLFASGPLTGNQQAFAYWGGGGWGHHGWGEGGWGHHGWGEGGWGHHGWGEGGWGHHGWGEGGWGEGGW